MACKRSAVRSRLAPPRPGKSTFAGCSYSPKSQHHEILRAGEAQPVQKRLVDAVEGVRGGINGKAKLIAELVGPPGRESCGWWCDGFDLRVIQCEAFYIVHNLTLYNANSFNRKQETAMSVNVLYKTSAKATGGRDGHAA